MFEFVDALPHLVPKFAEYQTPRENWTLKDVCKDARSYFLSPAYEKQCMIKCLTLTWGYIPKFGSPTQLNDPELHYARLMHASKSWFQLLIGIRAGIESPSDRDVLKIGSGKWRRVEDWQLSQMKCKLRYLCSAWYKSDCAAHHQDLYCEDAAIYELDSKDVIASFRSLQKGSMGLTSIGSILAGMELAKGINTMRLDDPWRLSKDFWTKREYVLRPFILRVLLLHPELVSRLTDVTDPLTPIEFLQSDLEEVCWQERVLWDIDVGKALKDHCGVINLDPLSFWDNLETAKIGPIEDWGFPTSRDLAYPDTIWERVKSVYTEYEHALWVEVAAYWNSELLPQLVPFDLVRYAPELKGKMPANTCEFLMAIKDPIDVTLNIVIIKNMKQSVEFYVFANNKGVIFRVGNFS